ncbi:MAG: ankyrin repeat domain-containing protein [Arcobacter sp.]|nr:ankyrin repeat domain-containing protein [Arcobacter sp.]
MSNNPIINRDLLSSLNKYRILSSNEEEFFKAVKRGLSHKIDFFIKNGMDINIRDKEGKNLLYWAMFNKDYENIKKLIKNNINLNVSPSLSAMNYAVYKNDVKLIKCLKNCGVSINQYDDVKSTPLIYAVLYNKLQSIDYLVSNGASLIHEDLLGNSALSLAYDLKIKYLINKFENILGA